MAKARGFLAQATVVCPYCARQARYVDSAVVYGKSYGKIWFCKPCDAWVGTHPNGSPLGTLANKTLRGWRMRAHRAFDPLWKDGLMTRSEAYKIMQEIMSLSSDRAHIAMFDAQQCQDLIMGLIRRNTSEQTQPRPFGRPKLLRQDNRDDETPVGVLQEVRSIEEFHHETTESGRDRLGV